MFGIKWFKSGEEKYKEEYDFIKGCIKNNECKYCKSKNIALYDHPQRGYVYRGYWVDGERAYFPTLCLDCGRLTVT